MSQFHTLYDLMVAALVQRRQSSLCDQTNPTSPKPDHRLQASVVLCRYIRSYSVQALLSDKGVVVAAGAVSC